MDVKAADSGASALAAMRKADAMGERLRLAIIDGHMPGMDGFKLAEQIRQDPRLSGAVIMMLSSTGQEGDAARCRRLGISAYLIKPIRKPELLSAILTALGQAPADAVRSPGKAKEPEPIGIGLQILLVEDNRINQTVALRMLEKMGHQAVLANNGLEALAQLSSKEFDLVLMDVQMPEMDGLTATKHIRAMEKNTGRHIAIVAMTARAMRGDREICLAAGMDAYLSKPIDREELGNLLRQMRSESKEPVLEAKTEMHPDSDGTRASSWNAGKVLENLGGDEKLLREIVDIFVEETPKLVERRNSGSALVTPTSSKPRRTVSRES
jgi:CheY-like chemotaxis protein